MAKSVTSTLSTGCLQILSICSKHKDSTTLLEMSGNTQLLRFIPSKVSKSIPSMRTSRLLLSTTDITLSREEVSSAPATRLSITLDTPSEDTSTSSQDSGTSNRRTLLKSYQRKSISLMRA